EAKRLLKLYWVLDIWRDVVDSEQLQKAYAQTFRSQLEALVNYYFDRGERNKAKLAVLLSDTTVYAERVGLVREQLEALQAQLIYFQRVDLTIDDLSECDRNLLKQGIYPVYEMQNWETIVLDH
ncbi:MAG: hypothetical protein AAF639_36070, partial [Chloroflexota bacterium]